METKDLMYKRAYVWDKLNAEERLDLDERIHQAEQELLRERTDKLTDVGTYRNAGFAY